MSLVFAFVALVLAAAGIVLLSLAVSTLRHARHSRGWPTRSAEITQIERRPIGLVHRVGNGVIWEVVVRYVFADEGAMREGNRLHFTIWRFGGFSSGPAAEMLERYRVVAQVMVHVNPEDASDSVIETKVEQAAIGTCVLLGVLFVVGGIWLMLAAAGWVAL